MRLLEKMNLPDDIKNLNDSELIELSQEVRDYISMVVKKRGGHIASSLGAVEIIIALLKVFDAKKDKIIFDIGHQAYAYKILTDRRESFGTLRSFNGVSGFPRPKESPYDRANSGHAGNALAIAVGYKEGGKLKGESFETISLIGDGAFASGMLHEGLNNLVDLSKQIIIINDNGYAISLNEGGFSGYLKLLRERKVSNPFEIYGVGYIGVVDGHNISELIKAFSCAKEQEKSVIIHVSTNKGMGYALAEQNPIDFHNFNAEKDLFPSCSSYVGETLSHLANTKSDLVVVTPAMKEGSGLVPFEKSHSDRFFDTGICEQYAVSFCSGLMREKLCVYLAIYSTFMQRGLDQLINDVVLDNLPLKLLIDRAGLTFHDGETHHGIFDLAFLSACGITVYNPFDVNELTKMLEASTEKQYPLAIRYSKEGIATSYKFNKSIDEWEYVIDPSSEILLIPVDMNMARECLSARELLLKEGISVGIVYAKTLYPLNVDFIETIKAKTVITVEDNIKKGGFGESLLLMKGDYSFEVVTLALTMIPAHGDRASLLRSVGLDAKNIAETVKKHL